MTSTITEPGPYDALDKARSDEPLFALLGRDPIAPRAVEFWSDATRKEVVARLGAAGPHSSEHDELVAKLRQCTEADVVAWDMRRWRKGDAEQDTATQTRASYSGTVASAEKNAETTHRAAIASAVASLREAAYFATGGLEGLAALNVLSPEEALALRGAVDAINIVAGEHTPKRPAFREQER